MSSWVSCQLLHLVTAEKMTTHFSTSNSSLLDFVTLKLSSLIFSSSFSKIVTRAIFSSMTVLFLPLHIPIYVNNIYFMITFVSLSRTKYFKEYTKRSTGILTFVSCPPHSRNTVLPKMFQICIAGNVNSTT